MKFNNIIKDIYKGEVENMEISQGKKDEILKNIEERINMEGHKREKRFKFLKKNKFEYGFGGIAAVLAFVLILVAIPAGASYFNKSANVSIQGESQTPKDKVQPADNKNNTTNKEEIKYTKYTNDKLHYSIEYPSVFITKEPSKENNYETVVLPDNDNGKDLITPDGSAEIIVYSEALTQSITADQDYQELLRRHPNATYKKQEGNWYVLSWTDDMGKIVYIKVVVGTHYRYYFRIAYPTNQKDHYDSIVDHLNSSFKILNSKF